jgi:hypothetical protein
MKMSVELVGTGSAMRMVVPQLPAVIGPETSGQICKDDVDPGYLCLISKVDGDLVVWDLGTKGGTFVNGSRITRATLRDSDTLGFGGNEYRVQADQSPRRYIYGVRN